MVVKEGGWSKKGRGGERMESVEEEGERRKKIRGRRSRRRMI